MPSTRLRQGATWCRVTNGVCGGEGAGESHAKRHETEVSTPFTSLRIHHLIPTFSLIQTNVSLMNSHHHPLQLISTIPLPCLVRQ